MFFTNINVWTVLAAAVAGMLVGFVWYAKWAFGPLWLKHKAWSDEALRAKKEGKPMWPTWLSMSVSTLASAFILAAVFNSLVVMSLWGILATAFLLWLAFVVPVKLAEYLYGADTLPFFLVSVGHDLVKILIMSVIVGLFV